ncbi:SCO1664 family protein [Micropruina sonneratiae]|uniref:SCO1664 family protein n=1 Tax=Micropruina sonneratiae TaxID=2986940 RepID=UPI0022278E07|nr:SCO1664 family protein [Micropruina sp. KQZ13P-5]MCW3158837.1 SCO1664 family protein [Micropruina sp. KQZ13P-5]
MTSADDREALLSEGEIALVGRVADSSNATFVAEVTRGDDYAWAIYKPLSGERPLWDFEAGLYKRERAAYLLDTALQWDLVPATVIRRDAPLGVGSLQWFIEHDPAEHYFTLLREHPATHDRLRRLAVFDVIGNNTDRKGGHVLHDEDGAIWAIDHGLCFAAEFKLRTVIWDFAGDAIDPDVLDAIAPLADEVPDAVADLLTQREVRAIRRRTQRLLDSGLLPADATGRAWPWPLV